MKSERFDIHQHITDQIIAAIEHGAGEFRLPWHRSAGNIMRPVNIASRKPYQGVNILTLWATADALGYSSGTWGTYRQWSEAGAQVRKGEKAAYIVFYKEITVASEPTDSDKSSTQLFARATPVFAAEQVDGYQAPVIDPLPATVISPIEHAEAFVAATGAIIEHGCSRAFYRPSADAIHMPPRQAFTGSHPGNFVQWRARRRWPDLVAPLAIQRERSMPSERIKPAQQARSSAAPRFSCHQIDAGVLGFEHGDFPQPPCLRRQRCTSRRRPPGFSREPKHSTVALARFGSTYRELSHLSGV